MLKRKPASDLPHYKNFHLFGVENDVTINVSLNNLFLFFFQKVLIAQMRSNVLLGDTNELLLIETTLQQLLFI